MTGDGCWGPTLAWCYEPDRPNLKTRVPPPVYALATAAVMWILDRWLPVLDQVDRPWAYVGLVLIATAVLSDLVQVVRFRRHRTTINPLAPGKATSLVTDGLYRYTRNPMYAGMAVSLVGWAIYLGSLTPWAMVPVFVAVLTHVQIKPEEQALAAKFGPEFDAYCSQVRRWF